MGLASFTYRLTSFFFSLYLSYFSKLLHCSHSSYALFFSSTFSFTLSFHHSLPFLIPPPTTLFPHTSLAHPTAPPLNQPHSSSTIIRSPLSLLCSSVVSPNLSS